MPRIFLSLSITALLLIAAALIYGLMGGDYNGISNRFQALQSQSPETLRDGGAQLDALLNELRPIQRHVRIHILLGILAALMAVLVQSIGVTYFIGTGRWCKEVVEAYQLDEQLVQQHTKLKRQAFPFALLGIAAVLTVSAFGAAADPGTLRENTQRWVKPHYWGAIIGLFVVAAALWRQAEVLVANQALIESILARVREIRRSRGLDV